MQNPIQNFWNIKFEEMKKTLEHNNYEVFLADTIEQAKDIVLNQIFPKTDAQSISWGGSMTLEATGLKDDFKAMDDLQIIDTSDSTISTEEKIERRRQALLVDLFLTGTNALTEAGHLVNLDMIGNRVGAITFGPKEVILLIGRNKIVPDLEAAMDRISNYASPVNAMRLERNTPCYKKGMCMDCSSSKRICNVWTIQEKSYPKGRIKIVLINEDLGF